MGGGRLYVSSGFVLGSTRRRATLPLSCGKIIEAPRVRTAGAGRGHRLCGCALRTERAKTRGCTGIHTEPNQQRSRSPATLRPSSVHFPPCSAPTSGHLAVASPRPSSPIRSIGSCRLPVAAPSGIPTIAIGEPRSASRPTRMRVQEATTHPGQAPRRRPDRQGDPLARNA